MVKKVVIASKNPVKIEATKIAFSKVFPTETFEFQGISAASDVSEQPIGEETYQGALNRVKNAQKKKKAEYYVGIEGGVEINNEVEGIAWIVIVHKDGYSRSRSCSFILPSQVSKALRAGGELGPIMNQLHSRRNVKREEGAVGIITNGLITRTDLYIQPLIFALMPFTSKSFE